MEEFVKQMENGGPKESEGGDYEKEDVGGGVGFEDCFHEMGREGEERGR